MSRRPIVAVAALAVGIAAVILVRSSPSAESSRSALPTEEEGRAALAKALEGAQSLGDRYCRRTVSRGDCESAWELAGGVAAVPRTAPRVTGVQVQGVRRILALCGTDGRGMPYHSDFAVTRVGGSIVPVAPVFWFDVRVVDPGVEVVAQALPPGSAPESCDS